MKKKPQLSNSPGKQNRTLEGICENTSDTREMPFPSLFITLLKLHENKGKPTFESTLL